MLQWLWGPQIKPMNVDLDTDDPEIDGIDDGFF